jgi:hypothetical protein
MHTSHVQVSSRNGFEYIADSFHWLGVSTWQGSRTILRLTQRCEDRKEPKPGLIVHVLNDGDCTSHSIKHGEDDGRRLRRYVIPVGIGSAWIFVQQLSSVRNKNQDRANLSSWNKSEYRLKIAKTCQKRVSAQLDTAARANVSSLAPRQGEDESLVLSLKCS